MNTTNQQTETKQQTFKRLQNAITEASEQCDKYFLHELKIDRETAVGDVYHAEQDFLNFVNSPEYNVGNLIRIINGADRGRIFRYNEISVYGYELILKGKQTCIKFQDAFEVNKRIYKVEN